MSCVNTPRRRLQIDAAALALRAGAKVIVRRAVEVDPEQRRIILHQHAPIPYDIASFDIGSTVAGLDVLGVQEHALPTRPIGLFVERGGHCQLDGRVDLQGIIGG
ncbi:MAG: hypothetical protein WAN46_05275 [Gammaproteobacteria bacterium]|jgi:selenide,water dikinase